MNPTQLVNLPASVRQRLLNLSRIRGEDFQFVLTKYAIERLLYRIAESKYAANFILKGAALIAVWTGSDRRPTRDVDFLSAGDFSDEGIREMFQDICQADVEPDGIQFDPDTIRIEEIREGHPNEGKRVRIRSNLDNAQIVVQVDISQGDPVIPDVKKITYPTLLEFPAPEILAYPPESVVSEKIEALVSFGIVTTRVKDIYDLLLLASSFDFEGSTLVEAITATFRKRETEIPRETPVAFTDEFANTDEKQKQWDAFLSRNRLEESHLKLGTVVERLRKFLLDPLRAAADDTQFAYKWVDGGPWK